MSRNDCSVADDFIIAPSLATAGAATLTPEALQASTVPSEVHTISSSELALELKRELSDNIELSNDQTKWVADRFLRMMRAATVSGQELDLDGLLVRNSLLGDLDERLFDDVNLTKDQTKLEICDSDDVWVSSDRSMLLGVDLSGDHRSISLDEEGDPVLIGEDEFGSSQVLGTSSAGAPRMLTLHTSVDSRLLKLTLGDFDGSVMIDALGDPRMFGVDTMGQPIKIAQSENGEPIMLGVDVSGDPQVLGVDENDGLRMITVRDSDISASELAQGLLLSFDQGMQSLGIITADKTMHTAEYDAALESMLTVLKKKTREIDKLRVGGLAIVYQ